MDDNRERLRLELIEVRDILGAMEHKYEEERALARAIETLLLQYRMTMPKWRQSIKASQ